jgi:hypothetical protein
VSEPAHPSHAERQPSQQVRDGGGTGADGELAQHVASGGTPDSDATIPPVSIGTSPVSTAAITTAVTRWRYLVRGPAAAVGDVVAGVAQAAPG